MTARPWLACVLAVGLCPVAACSEQQNHSSSSPAFGDRRPCPGAYSVHSEECWDRSRPTSQQITADRVETEFRGIGLGDRCALPANRTPGTEGNMNIVFTTLPLGRTQYGPKNCGAVWIEDELEGYVRTLDVWVKERDNSITMWGLRRCTEDPSIVDAISSATLDLHVEHKVKWNGRDWRNNVVPDGRYTLWLQVTENEIVPEGPYIEIPFVKSAMTVKQEYMATDGFSVVTIDWQPGPSQPNKTLPTGGAAGASAAGAGGAPAGGTGAPTAGSAGPTAGSTAPTAGVAAPIAGASAP